MYGIKVPQRFLCPYRATASAAAFTALAAAKTVQTVPIKIVTTP